MINKLISAFSFFLITSLGYAATVENIEVQSNAMKKKVSIAVVIPASNGSSNLPVLYLLHGYTDNQTAWLSKVPDKSLVGNMADKYNMIIVLPDGDVSWYMDSPLKKDMQYETFITKELVKFIDEKYKTIKSREGRVISGLSMGGHGALYLAIRNPQLYLAAGSIAGALDLTPIKSGDVEQLFHKLLGEGQELEQRKKENSVLYMTDKLKTANLSIIVDCGLDDFLYQSNKAFHQKLVEEKIPHDYTERPGKHDWEYFSNSLEYHMVFFQKAMKKAKI